MSDVDFKKLTVPALKAELAKFGIDTTGLKKADLVAKLEEATAAAKTAQTTTAEAEPAAAPIVTSPSAVAASAASPSKNPTSPLPSSSTTAASTSASTAPSLKSATEDKLPQGGEAAELIAARKRRAEKFGTTFTLTEDDKKKAREARFGPTAAKKQGEGGEISKAQAAVSAVTGLEPKAKKSKTENGAAAPTPVSAEELEKLSKRASKFGTGTPQAVVDAAETEKRLKRAARFSNPSSSPSTGSTTAAASSVPAASLTAQ